MFKIGDRVAVYDYQLFDNCRQIGIITSVDKVYNTLEVNFHFFNNDLVTWFHAQQCRKLVEKKHPKPTLGFFSNETQNAIFKERCFDRIDDLERRCSLIENAINIEDRITSPDILERLSISEHHLDCFEQKVKFLFTSTKDINDRTIKMIEQLTLRSEINESRIDALEEINGV